MAAERWMELLDYAVRSQGRGGVGEGFARWKQGSLSCDAETVLYYD